MRNRKANGAVVIQTVRQCQLWCQNRGVRLFPALSRAVL
jgi:hypothetical protein